MDLKALIREVPDFPRPGVSFKDITTLMKEPEALAYAIRSIADHFRGAGVQMVVGVESRGFVLGAPLAYAMGTGFVLIRKPGKLPAPTYRVEYDLEYGRDALEIHQDSLRPGERVLLVDDLLATGGTISAAARLVKRLEARIAGFGFLVELSFLHGRDRLKETEVSEDDIVALVRYDS